MSDYLLAIWAQRDTCKPYTGPGRVGHVVRISTDEHMTIINEFATGGALAHSSCGPSSLQSWLLDKTTIRTTIAHIESLADTTLNGTSFVGLDRATIDLGQKAVIGRVSTPGAVMNPGGGYIDPIDEFPAYEKARQGGNDCLLLTVVTAPQPMPVPTPQPLPTQGAKPVFIAQNPHAGDYLVFENGQSAGIGSSAVVTAFETELGLKVIGVDDETIANIKALTKAGA